MKTIDEGCRRRFETHRLDGGELLLEEFLLDEDNPNYDVTLEELVLIDLEFRWKEYSGSGAIGPKPSARDYAQRFPRLARPEVLDRIGRESAWLVERYGEGADCSGSRIGHYELRERAGSGAFADVWHAYDEALKRNVALKIPRPGMREQAGVFERVRREAQSAARLSHPGIVSVYEVGEHQGRPFFALEYVKGPTLAERMHERSFAPREAARLVARVADAAGYAHECGVVHRDIKPGNILISEDERPKLADFGLAQLAAVESHLTRKGDVLGTPSYMAPEQAKGSGAEMGPRTDVYGLGVLLYELLSGHKPFAGLTAAATIHAVIHDEPERPSSHAASIPPDLETICLKAMSKEPARRYESAQDLAADLRRFLGSLPIQARRRGMWGRFTLWVRRNPALSVTLAASFFAVVTIGAIGLSNVLAERSRYRSERDRAHANLFRSLLGEAEAVVEAQWTDWYPRAMERLREAAALVETSDDRLLVRNLVLRCEGTLRVSINKVAVWEAAHGRAEALSASPDGTEVAGITGRGELWIRSIETGDVRVHTHLGAVRATCLAWHLSGRSLLLGFEDGRLEVRDPLQFALLASLTGDGEPLNCLAQHPGGEILAVGRETGAIELIRWRRLTRKLARLSQLAGHTGGTLTLEFSADGTRVVSGGMDNAIRVWDWSNRAVDLVANETEPVAIVRCAPEGNTVATSTRVQFGFRLLRPPDPVLHGRRADLLFHSAAVTMLSFTRDGFIVSASMDGSLTVWNARFENLARGQTGMGPIRAGAQWGGGAQLLLSHEDGRISRWQLGSPGTVHGWATIHAAEFVPGTRRLVTDRNAVEYEPDGPPRIQPFGWIPVASLTTRGERVFGSCENGDLLIWEDPAALPRRIVTAIRGVTCMDVSGDGRRAVVGTAGGSVWTVDLTGAGSQAREFTTPLGRVHAIILGQPDPGSALVMGVSGLVVLNLAGELEVLDDNPRRIGAMAQGGGLLAVSSPDGRIEIMRKAGADPVVVLEAHDSPITFLAFSRDGRRLVSSDSGTQVRLWDTATWNAVWTHVVDFGPMRSICIDPSGEIAVLCGAKAEALDLVEHRPFAKFLVEHATTATFDTSGENLLIGSRRGAAWRWSTASLIHQRDRMRRRFREGLRAVPSRIAYERQAHAGGHAWWIWGLATSPDGRWIATSGHTGDVNLWDAQTLRHVRTVLEGGELAWTVAFSPDSKSLAAGSGGNAVLFDVEGGAARARCEAHTRLVIAMAFHPSGRLLVTCGEDRRVRLWDPSAGRPLGTLDAQERRVNAVVFSPDGRHLAGAAGDGSILIWDASPGAFVNGAAPGRRLVGHVTAVQALAYDPTGTLLATGADSGKVLIRDAESGAIHATLRASANLRRLSFSGDGRYLAAASYVLESRTWDLVRLRTRLREWGLDWE